MQGKKEWTLKKKSIRTSWIQGTVMPILLLGIIILALSVSALINGMEQEISRTLAVAAKSLDNTYSMLSPGDYVMEDGVLKKGDRVLTGDYSIIDEMKEAYNTEITLFYGDERVLTTIMDAKGRRMAGTKAAKETAQHVLEGKSEYFSGGLKINNTPFFGYYVPVFNEDGTVVGMAFAGKTSKAVWDSVSMVVVKSVLVSLLVVLAALMSCMVASRGMIDSIRAIMEYLGHLAQGDFTKAIPDSVLERKDEIGEMGRYAVIVSSSLRDMVAIDPLTGISNRRNCGAFLQREIEQCEKYQENRITVAIGDIDFFKKVNDRYGHECGDMVLVTIADIFKRHFNQQGMAARWGGEEFLFVFEKPLAQAKADMQEILDEIRAFDFLYEEKHFKVTMSVGMNGNIVGENFDKIVKAADDMLYRGKEGGRNRIVTTEGEVILPT